MTTIARFGNDLGDPNADVMLWGGKGAGLMRMASDGLPVPPGFTISTAMCTSYEKAPEQTLDLVMQNLQPHLQWLQEQFGYMPLLSVRSGAPVSMPGMMDTILNVGMTRPETTFWAAKIGLHGAWDSYRRLLQMYGDTVLGIEKVAFEQVLSELRGKQSVKTDAELSLVSLEQACARFETLYHGDGHKEPNGLQDQLRGAIGAVFKSWRSPRAIEYRKMEGIPEDWGTAVTVQAMVFGNMNDQSGSGVLFTRNPSTGEPGMFGEFLPNAQGEDVVAGVRTPLKLEQMKKDWPVVYEQLNNVATAAEVARKDMQDMEFTVQDGTLYMLQTRSGKRSAQAAFRIAMDMVDEKLITPDEAISRVSTKQYKVVKRPSIDPEFKTKHLAKGLEASVGIGTGKVALSSEKAVEMAKAGEKVILVTHETTPDDIAGMYASVGILTQTGGATSHAAVVARGMDKPCVVGLTSLLFTANGFTLGGTVFEEGSEISIDGSTGKVWKGKVPVVDSTDDPYVKAFFDMLMKTKGLIEKTPTPAPGVCVTLSDWAGWSEAQIDKALNAVTDVLNGGGQMMVDVSGPALGGDKVDNLIWDIACDAPERSDHVNVIGRLTGISLKGVTLVGETGPEQLALLTSAGAQTVPVVSTLHDLLKANGVVKVDDTLMAFMASTPDDQKVIMDMLKKNGMKAKLVTDPLPRSYAAFVFLGA